MDDKIYIYQNVEVMDMKFTIIEKLENEDS